jgi:hypothetical protein
MARANPLLTYRQIAMPHDLFGTLAPTPAVNTEKRGRGINHEVPISWCWEVALAAFATCGRRIFLLFEPESFVANWLTVGKGAFMSTKVKKFQ